MIVDDFKEIFDRFENEKRKRLKGNELASKMRNEFNNGFTEFISDLVSDDYEYVTKISPGIGNWVHAPWANIRYKIVSESFQNGFYIVTLFDLENKILKMGLIQGKDKISEDLLESRFKFIYQKLLDKFPKFTGAEEDGNFIILVNLHYNDLNSLTLKESYKEIIEIYESLIPDYLSFTNQMVPEIPKENDAPPHYWLFAPGQNAFLWDEFYNENIMAIGWNEVGNLKEYSNKDEIKLMLQEIYNDNKSHINDVHTLWQFANEINIGDIVFAKKGMSEILGVGFVESDYEFNENLTFSHVRKINWVKREKWSYKGKFAMKTLTDITYHEMLGKIKKLVGEIKPPCPKYSVEEFLDEVYIEEKEYNTIVNLLKRKKNLIVQGPPGVGKTFLAKRLAYSIMGVEDSSRVVMVQFHQSYSYEDFVMGYRPTEDSFELKEGSFYNFCKKAESDPKNDYFFIIDEINRGNLSKIFGELFMLIEGDKRGEEYRIPLLYNDESFFIPENIYIIGLMNTADRSLAMIDYALRRRFSFFNLNPGFATRGFENYRSMLNNEIFDRLIEIIKDLNDAIYEDVSLGEGFTIGHSFLCNVDSDDVGEQLKNIVDYELIPLLKEYWFDEPENVENWSKRLRSVFD